MALSLFKDSQGAAVDVFPPPAQELCCCPWGCTAVPGELRGLWLWAVLCWQPGLSTEQSPPHRQPGKLCSRGVSASQLPWDGWGHSPVVMDTYSIRMLRLGWAAARCPRCLQATEEMTPVTITSSKNCQTP